MTADGRLVAVSVKPGASFEFGAPKELFKIRLAHRPAEYRTSYAVTRDGERFLMSTATEEPNAVPTKIVLNWLASLGRR